MRRSMYSSPGNHGSWSGGMVLTYGVETVAGKPTWFSRARSSSFISRNRARVLPWASRTASKESTHSAVSSGSMSGSWCENPSKITPPSSRSISRPIGARLRALDHHDADDRAARGLAPMGQPLSRTRSSSSGWWRLAKADAATIGVVAPALRADLHVTDAQLGLLAALSSVTGALCALPAGGLVDRRHRPADHGRGRRPVEPGPGSRRLRHRVRCCWRVARLVSGGFATVARPVSVSLAGDLYHPHRGVGPWPPSTPARRPAPGCASSSARWPCTSSPGGGCSGGWPRPAWPWPWGPHRRRPRAVAPTRARACRRVLAGAGARSGPTGWCWRRTRWATSSSPAWRRSRCCSSRSATG